MRDMYTSSVKHQLAGKQIEGTALIYPYHNAVYIVSTMVVESAHFTRVDIHTRLDTISQLLGFNKWLRRLNSTLQKEFCDKTLRYVTDHNWPKASTLVPIRHNAGSSKERNERVWDFGGGLAIE